MNLPMRVLLLPGLLLLAACSTTGRTERSSANDQKAVITERALARWDALIKRDGATAWTYLSPGYRATYPKEKYATDMANRPVKWSKVEPFSAPESVVEGETVPALETVECINPESSCTIRLKVHFSILSTTAGVGLIQSWNVVKESWVRVKGKWYLVPEVATK